MLRAVSDEGLADWQALAATNLFSTFVQRGRLIPTEVVDGTAAAEIVDGRWAGLLRHERIPFVSYPYEWTFGMLKDAALLQLELLLAALDEDLILKDSSPYNVQWRGSQPVFIDIGSFERLRAGEPWIGYRQFCMLYLYPLLLQAYKGIPFQPWLRARIDGVEPREVRGLFGGRDALRRGVLTHVVLHSRLEERYGDKGGEVKRELRSAGFGKDLIRVNVARMQKLVRGLEWEPDRSVWARYSATKTYSDDDTERKKEFVRRAVSERRRSLVWDVGANDGLYSRVAAESAECVVAMDFDHSVAELLYRSLRGEGDSTILPLVADIVDPSPGLGWRGVERKSLLDRARPDVTLCLALVHHVVITRNVPMREFLDLLRSLGTSVVIEFPTRDDTMVQRLLAAKREGMHGDYDREPFERELRDAFDVERTEELPSGTRLLYFAHPKR